LSSAELKQDKATKEPVASQLNIARSCWEVTR